MASLTIMMRALFSGKVKKMFWGIREERKIPRSLILTWYIGVTSEIFNSNPNTYLRNLWIYKENH